MAILVFAAVAPAQEPPTEPPKDPPAGDPQAPQEPPPDSPPAQDTTPADAPPAEPAPLKPSDEPLIPDDLFGVPIHGSFNFRYLLRTTSHDSDQDIYGFLGVDVGDPEKQRVTARLLVKAAWDVDGDIHNDGFSTFDSLEDTYDRRLTAQLYEAYGDYHADGPVDFVRFGRSVLWETPVQTYFDGLRVDTNALGEHSWKFGVYGGVPSHLYESSPEGDVILGAFGEVRPLPSTRTRLDWMQVQDEYLGSDRQNALVRLAVWQQLGPTVSAYGGYSLLDWNSRDLELRGTWAPEATDFQLDVGYFQLFTTQAAEAIEFDPYFDSAGEYDPYREFRVSASKGFGDHVSVAAGADIRRLVHDDDEAEFNHDFERWYLSPALIDWPIVGLTTTITGELWDDHDEWTSAVDLDVTYEFTEATRGHAGTSYSLYKYDYLTMSERDHVRTYYVGIDTEATKRLRLRLDYIYEDDEFDDYNTLRAAATWTF